MGEKILYSSKSQGQEEQEMQMGSSNDRVKFSSGRRGRARRRMFPPLPAAAGKSSFFPASVLPGQVPAVGPSPIAVPSESLLSVLQFPYPASHRAPVGTLNSGIPIPNHQSGAQGSR